MGSFSTEFSQGNFSSILACYSRAAGQLHHNIMFFVYCLCRGGKYSEDDAKTVMVQILNVVAFCHLQGVVHRDLKPEVKVVLSYIDRNPGDCWLIEYVKCVGD